MCLLMFINFLLFCRFRLGRTVIYSTVKSPGGYLGTQEGKNLPVVHCVRGTPGWEIRSELDALRTEEAIDKPTFGSTALGELLKTWDTQSKENGETGSESVTLDGLCTDICVISNALLVKSFLPEVPITVDASCCAGVTPQSHKTALEAMKMCQIQVVGEAA